MAFALVLVLLAGNSFFIVEQHAQVVVFNFDEAVRSEARPGLHLKIPFVQRVRHFDARILSAESPASLDALHTADGRSVAAIAVVRWHIADATAYYRATGGQPLKAADLLAKALSRGVADVLAAHTLAEALSGDAELDGALEQSLAHRVQDLGGQLVDAQFETVGLSKDSDYARAVYERMRAERARVAADLRARGGEEAQKIRAQADAEAQTVLGDAYRDAQKLRGEGDARAAEIYAKAYGQDPEFFSFYRSLNAYRDAFADSRHVLVVEPRGEFFKYFRGGDAH
jgi:membrane protease subunit HflC